MVKLGIFYEQDNNGKDTGRVQVGEVGGDELVEDTFDTEEEAQIAMVKLQAKFDEEDELKKEYLEWEKGFLHRHPTMCRNGLRSFLVNVVVD